MHRIKTTPNGLDSSSSIHIKKYEKSKQVICVFCGSSTGNNPAYMEAAQALARKLHENDINMVYGGGTLGLMGEISKTLVSLSGPDSVHGIVPAAYLEYQNSLGPKNNRDEIIPDRNIYGKTTVVESLQERKQLMIKEVLSGAPGSGFIALPGGYGTIDEIMDMIAQNGIGIHNKGVVIFNIEGFWNGLFEMVKRAVEAGFVAKDLENLLVEARSPEECVELLSDHRDEKGRIGLTWSSDRSVTQLE